MFTIIDIQGLLLATLAAGVIIALPGLALARLFAADGEARLPALPTALAVLPALTSLIARLVSLDVALACDLAMATCGAVLLATRRGRRPRIEGAALAILAVWLVFLIVEWVDYDVAGRLYRPSTIIDTVKHAATTQAIVDSGAPPRDAFFLRPERASYYYFFYTLTALVQRLCLGYADAKAAVGGAIFWVGVGVYTLIGTMLHRIGISLVATGPRRGLIVLAVLCAGGLDIVPTIGYVLHSGVVLADPLWWNEQVSIWSESLLWVPHHVTGLIAGLVGLLALCELIAASAAVARARWAVLAGLSFASTLGLSVWVCLALVTSAGVWSLCLLVERRWRAVALIAGAGVGALLFSMPTLVDLHAGRSGAPMPIAIEVRAFTLTDSYLPPGPWRTLVRLVALPLNYLLEFGVLAVGSWIFWTGRERTASHSEMTRVLAIAAGTGLLLGALVSSTIYNNDLGWRVTLFPLFAGTLWTIAVLDRALAVRPENASLWIVLPPGIAVCLVLGWATSLAAIGTMRAYPWLPLQSVATFMAADPRTERELRVAYSWAGAHLPAKDVIQHDPAPHRAFDFALYSRNPTAVSDHFAALYGADAKHVAQRLTTISSLYGRVLPAAMVKSIAQRDGIDDLVVTSADPIWTQAGSFVWATTPIYASDHVRIIAVDRLGG